MTLPPLPERLTHAQADAYLARCLQALPSAVGGVSVEAGALQAFDSSVLAVLLAVRRQVQARGGTLRVAGLPERLRGLAVLYGVSELLPA